MAATEQVKRDRVGVLASTIVKELASQRIRDLTSEKDIPDPPVVMTAELRRLLREWTVARAAEKRATEAKQKIENAVEKLGYRVTKDHGKEPKIEWPYRRWDLRIAAAKQARAVRANTVREMRTAALIDLVTLDPNEAKAAVKAFRSAIEKV
jgi:hypothetical protein